MQSFTDQSLLAELEALSDEALDELPFGVIALDAELTCTRYNALEAEKAGLSKSRVIGRHFFEEVAPCMNNFLVADRMRGSSIAIDDVIDYTLSVKIAPAAVKLRLLGAPDIATRYLLVDWPPV